MEKKKDMSKNITINKNSIPHTQARGVEPYDKHYGLGYQVRHAEWSPYPRVNRLRRVFLDRPFDIDVERGDTIYSAFDGKVRIASYQRRGYGHYVVIRHDNGLETLYAHLSKKLVGENQNVKAGEPIGLGGNSGRSSGSHLHFETLLMGKSLNPALLFDFKNQDVTGDTYIYRKPGSRYVENGKVKVAGPEPKYHKVKSGETISRIAAKHGVSQKTIFKLNGLNSRSVIRPGQRLRYQ